MTAAWAWIMKLTASLRVTAGGHLRRAGLRPSPSGGNDPGRPSAASVDPQSNQRRWPAGGSNGQRNQVTDKRTVWFDVGAALGERASLAATYYPAATPNPTVLVCLPGGRTAADQRRTGHRRAARLVLTCYTG